MATLRELLLKVDADVSGLKSKLQSAGQSVDQFKGKTQGLSSVGVGLSASLGAIGGILATKLVGSLAQAGTTILTFQSDTIRAFQQINFGVDESSFKFKLFSDAVASLGQASVSGPLKLAQAVKTLSSFFDKESEVLQAASDANDMYAATGLDANQSAQLIVKTLGAFNDEGLNSTNVMYKLSAASLASGLGMEELDSLINMVGPSAVNAGLSLNQFLATAAAIKKETGQTGRQLSGSFLSGLNALSDPTSAASQAIEQWGVKVKNARGFALPFNDIVDQLSFKVQGNKQRFLELSNILGNPFAQYVRDGGDKYSTFLKKIESGKVPVDNAIKQYETSLRGAFDKFRASTQLMSVLVGSQLEEPLKKALTELAEAFNKAFKDIDPKSLDAIKDILLQIIKVIPELTSSFPTIASVFKATVDAMVVDFERLKTYYKFLKEVSDLKSKNPALSLGGPLVGAGAKLATDFFNKNQVQNPQQLITKQSNQLQPPQSFSTSGADSRIEEILRANSGALKGLENRKIEIITNFMGEIIDVFVGSEADLRKELGVVKQKLENSKKKTENIQPAPQAGSA